MTTEVDEMQCKELIQLVTEYLEGTIADANREQIETHASECAWCERYIEQTRQVIGALGTLDENAADSEAWQRALASFRSRQRR